MGCETEDCPVCEFKDMLDRWSAGGAQDEDILDVVMVVLDEKFESVTVNPEEPEIELDEVGRATLAKLGATIH